MVIQLHNGNCRESCCPIYEAAFDLVCKVYEWEFGTPLSANSRPPRTIVVVSDEGRVLATAGILLPHEVNPLPTQQYFGLDLPAEEWESTFEIGKLAFELRTASTTLPALVYALGRYAAENGIRQAVACMKPNLIRILERHLGLPITRYDLKVIRENVEPEYSGYFLEGDSPQVVKFVRSDLDIVADDIRRRIADTVASIDLTPHGELVC